MLCSDEIHTPIVLHLLTNGHHTPIVKGKCNRDSIEEQITLGIYAKTLPPMDQEDVDWVIALIDDVIMDYKNNPQEYRQG